MSAKRIHVTKDFSEQESAPPIQARDPLTMIIFGATGDLSLRKLIPGLYVMFTQGYLPDEFAIVGAGRRDYNDESYRDWMKEAIQEHSRIEPESESCDEFCSHLYYHKGDITEEQAYERLRDRLNEEGAFPDNRLFYLSIKPDLFETVVALLERFEMISEVESEHWTRVVIEKPFGHDPESAHELNLSIRKHLAEPQIYRIDHYLGKETVQNILSFRLANVLFEPVFNNHYVDHIQITASETVGMESGRGAYYDTSGAVRDMVQNHMLQLLCLATMEPPADLTAQSVHNEKVKVLHSLQVDEKNDCPAFVRAQYEGAEVDGEHVPGYREEDRVSDESMTAAYAAIRMQINNWRWVGVPIYLRTGKRLKDRVTEIVVQFKTPPLELFQTVECVGDVCDMSLAKPNKLVFRIQPYEGISLKFSAKRPGLQVQVESVDMDFSYRETWQKELPEAYERLLLDVMRGDSTLFTRSDEVDAAWRAVDPILNAWEKKSDKHELYHYPAGSWGPEEAEKIFLSGKTQWRNPTPSDV